MTRRLSSGLATLLLALAAPIPATAQPSPGWSLAAAEGAADAVEAMRDDPAFAPFFQDPAITTRLRQAHAKLALAKDSLADTRNRYAGSQAHEFAVAAERAFREIERELWRRRRRVETTAAGVVGNGAVRRQLLSDIAALVGQGRELLARPGSSWPNERQARAELGRALEAARGIGAATPLERLETVRSELTAATLAARYAYRTWPSQGPPLPPAHWVETPPPAPVPARLRQAVERFLAGDYRGVVQLLVDPNLENGRATALAYLLRGAARYALFVESGEREGELLTAAQADAHACRRSDPSVQPVRDTFSPRYLALFAEP